MNNEVLAIFCQTSMQVSYLKSCYDYLFTLFG